MRFMRLTELPSTTTGIWSRCGVHLFEGRLTIEDMDEMQRRGDDWMAHNPGRIVEMSIIFPSDSKMTAEERSRMARLIAHREKSRDASATVILAEGITGSMQRTILNGLMILARPTHPSKVFANIHDAVLWLAPYARTLCGREATPTSLLNGIEELCAGFQARRAPMKIAANGS